MSMKVLSLSEAICIIFSYIPFIFCLPSGYTCSLCVTSHHDRISLSHLVGDYIISICKHSPFILWLCRLAEVIYSHFHKILYKALFPYIYIYIYVFVKQQLGFSWVTVVQQYNRQVTHITHKQSTNTIQKHNNK
jgi:hypothetical protein